jgi:hypothetical protein
MLTEYNKQLDKLKKTKIISLSFLFFAFGVKLASAGPLVPYSHPEHPSHEIYNSGSYSLNDLLLIGVNYSNAILGIVGSLALLMFVYGGFMFLISSGNSEKVTKARGIVIAAVVGLAIVFASYLIIQFVMQAFGATTPFTGGIGAN